MLITLNAPYSLSLIWPFIRCTHTKGIELPRETPASCSSTWNIKGPSLRPAAGPLYLLTQAYQGNPLNVSSWKSSADTLGSWQEHNPCIWKIQITVLLPVTHHFEGFHELKLFYWPSVLSLCSLWSLQSTSSFIILNILRGPSASSLCKRCLRIAVYLHFCVCLPQINLTLGSGDEFWWMLEGTTDNS